MYWADLIGKLGLPISDHKAARLKGCEREKAPIVGYSNDADNLFTAVLHGPVQSVNHPHNQPKWHQSTLH